MTNEVESLSRELDQAIAEFLTALQTMKGVNESEFSKIDRIGRRLATRLKGQDQVSKLLMRRLYSLARVIRAEAPYNKGKADVLEKMADQVELIFGTILWDETFEERVPGVPRIR